MSDNNKVIYPSNQLTVIIRDDSPMMHCNDSPSYRSVSILLTDEQILKLGLKLTDTVSGTNHYESISKCFIEPNDSR